FRACHDLRTHVRAIRTNAQMLIQGRAAPEDGPEKQLAQIERGAARLEKMVDGLAHLAVALETDRKDFQPVDLGFLARGGKARLGKELGGAGADVAFQDLPTVTGHPDRLLEVLENLVRNALVHRGAAAPRVRISAADEGGVWRITVEDNGPGVPD